MLFSKAGMPLGQLILVTEAEATFAYCQRLMVRNHNQQIQEGTDYMVVDIGGKVFVYMKMLRF